MLDLFKVKFESHIHYSFKTEANHHDHDSLRVQSISSEQEQLETENPLFRERVKLLDGPKL